MRLLWFCLFAVLLGTSCTTPAPKSDPVALNPAAPQPDNAPPAAAPPAAPTTAPPATDTARTAAVAADTGLYNRVEGTGSRNDCQRDTDCVVSGCSKEVCSAEEVMTSCEVREWPQGQGAQCGCVAGQCIWYR